MFDPPKELLEVFLHELPPGLKPVVEFRHASWLADDTYEVLKRFGVALCIADSEDRTTPVEVRPGRWSRCGP